MFKVAPARRKKLVIHTYNYFVSQIDIGLLNELEMMSEYTMPNFNIRGGIAVSFVHLQVCSSYTLLESTVKIDSLVAEAKMKGFSAIALTDRNVMYGAIAFYQACIRNGIKPIIGLTVDVIKDEQEEQGAPLVLLAKNNTGYENLLKISSAVQTKSPKGIPLKWLKAYTKGLFALTPGKEGKIESYVLNEKLVEAKNMVEQLKTIFEPNSFYLTIQYDNETNEHTLIKKMASLASVTHTKLVATNDVHYLSSDDRFAHACLAAIKTGQQMEEVDWHKYEFGQRYLKSGQEMQQLFSEYPDAIRHTIEIAQQCQVTLQLHRHFIPRFPIEGTITSEELLRKQCNDGLQKRYQEPTEEHWKRLEYELDIIRKMQFSDYFLIIWDIMRYAKKQNILTGPGRGSAAGSIVAYVLFITDVDPIAHQLLFERFLNPERITMPDIDLDFPDNRRDEIIQYVVEKYGELHVAQIITFGTLATKAVIRDVAKVFAMPTREIDTLTPLFASRSGALKEIIRDSKAVQSFMAKSRRHQLFLEVASKLEGLPRHTSTHAAGVIISEKPLVEIVPIQAGHDGTHLTQYPMDDLEALGLLKMDFLGLRNLSLIDAIIRSIRRKTGHVIQMETIPLRDEETFQLLSRGETSGIFQLESKGMRQVLSNLKPTNFEDIVAVNALYRPGPMENIPVYVERKHGRQPITYPHPDLQSILENTYGVIVYQEQIMQIASKMAGFTLGEADLLRRAVGKKQKEILQKEREHFVQGAREKGYNENIANHIYDLIVRFANYGFNKSHAVAYSFIAYQLAFLKTHYPLFFMAELLTSAIGNEQKISEYIIEVEEMGYAVSPPSINRSTYSFQAVDNEIRYSLAAIKGVGSVALKAIFAARKEKRFSDLFDFCMRVPVKAVNRKTLESLIYSGCFDEFGKDRAVLLATLDVALNHAQLVQPTQDDNTDQTAFFLDEALAIKPKYVDVEPITLKDKLHYEKQVLGLYLSNHPVSIYENVAVAYHVTPLHKLKEHSNGIHVIVLINEVKKIRTKKGEAMAFLTVSDQSGEMSAVVFPQVYRQSSVFLREGEIVLINGSVEQRKERKQLVVRMCKKVEEVAHERKQSKQTLYIKVSDEIKQSGKLHELKKILKEYQGDVPVVLYYEQEDRAIQLARGDWVSPENECITRISSLLGKENVILKE